jgi:hypothetical protein
MGAKDGHQNAGHVIARKSLSILPSSVVHTAPVPWNSARMRKHILHRLFEPESVALVGASEKQGSVGLQVLQNLLSADFQGEIESLQGLECYPSVGDIPGSHGGNLAGPGVRPGHQFRLWRYHHGHPGRYRGRPAPAQRLPVQRPDPPHPRRARPEKLPPPARGGCGRGGRYPDAGI